MLGINLTSLVSTMTQYISSDMGIQTSTETIRLAKELLEQTKDMDEDKRSSIVMAAPELVRRAYYKIRKDSFFIPENARPDYRTKHQSPSGKYQLIITPYKTTGWEFSQGLVYEGDKLIAEIRRNYAMFPFAWAEYHPKGSFLICGEDYQGQSVVNLCSGEVLHSRPEEANIGAGFCWSSIHPSPSQQILAVSGCYWACPYEVIFYDFSDPMTMPWPIIDAPSDCEEFLEWSDCDEDDKAIVGKTWEICSLEGPLYGKKADDLTDEELDFITKEASKQGLNENALYQIETDPKSIWTRPSNDQIARKRILELAWRKEKNLPMLRGWVDLIEYWILRCTPEQKAAIEAEHKELLDWFRSNVVTAQELWPTK